MPTGGPELVWYYQPFHPKKNVSARVWRFDIQVLRGVIQCHCTHKDYYEETPFVG